MTGRDRYLWEPLNECYHFDATTQTWNAVSLNWPSETPASSPSRLRVVTWNVQFDVFQQSQPDTITVTTTTTTTMERWIRLLFQLKSADADLIALQEVTPSFLQLLSEQNWVRDLYALQTVPGNEATVTPHGNLWLWKRSSLVQPPQTMYHCVDQGKH